MVLGIETSCDDTAAAVVRSASPLHPPSTNLILVTPRCANNNTNSNALFLPQSLRSL